MQLTDDCIAEVCMRCDLATSWSLRLTCSSLLNSIPCTFEYQYNNEIVCSIAAFEGHLNLLKMLLDWKYPWTDSIVEFAAEGGHIHILEWMKDRFKGIKHPKVSQLTIFGFRLSDEEDWKTASSDEDEEEHQHPLFNTRVLSYAAYGGHIEALEWFRENKCPSDLTALEYAVEGGHLHVLEWMDRTGWFVLHGDSVISDPGFRFCERAAELGHLEVLKWLIKRNSFWDRYHCLALCEKGSETHKWLLTR